MIPNSLACEQCRSSKLRRRDPDPSSQEQRCDYCARMERECEFADSPLARTQIKAECHDGEERLAKLESKLTSLLDLMQGSNALRPDHQVGSIFL